MGKFHRLVWAGAIFYTVLLVPILIFAVPRMTARASIGITPGQPPAGNLIARAEPFSGLSSGDRILSINGDTRVGSGTIWAGAWLRWPVTGGSVALLIQNGQGTRTVNLTVRRIASPDSLAYVVLNLVASLSFFAVGLLMAWKRPGLYAARVGWLATTLCALHYLALTLNVLWTRNWAVPLALTLPMLVFPLHTVASYYFASMFPTGRPETGPWKLLTVALLGSAPLYWLLSVPLNFDSILNGEPFLWLSSRAAAWVSLGRSTQAVMYPLVTFATCAVLIRNLRRAGADERRRIGWLIAAACLPLTVTATSNLLRYRSGIYILPANAAVLVVPLALGYALLKHQVMGIRVAIRRSIQYILARRVLEAAMVLPVLMLVATAILRPELRIRELIHPAHAVLVGAAAVGLLVRRRVLTAVDRRFFRPAWDEEQLLAGLVAAIRGQIDFQETAATVVNSIERAVHPAAVHIVCRQERGGPLLAGEITLPEATGLFEQLASNPSVVVSPRLLATVTDEERAWLGQSNAALLVPIPGSVRLRGILILGPKRSEESYTAAERKLFAAVAAQMSVAHETHWLANERVAAVLAERNRMARELHDSLAQGFAGISLHLQSAAKNIDRSPGAALDHVEQARRIARASLAEARRSVHDLRTSQPNLAAMLRELTEQLSSEAVEVELNVSVLPELSDELTRNLFRIAQESVTNALKHAVATRITISLSTVDHQVLLRVSDNGRGFETSKSRLDGYGLVGMRERAGQINGQLEITSEAGQGTEVIVQAHCS